MHNSQFIVAHLSARRQYDVARLLDKNHLLLKLFTDAYYDETELPLFNLLNKILPAKIVNTYKQYRPQIPADKIEWNWVLALFYKTALSLRSEGNYKAKVTANGALLKKVIGYCSTQPPAANNFYGFDAASLEFFRWASKKNWHLYLEQCGAPRGITIRMHERFQSELGIDEKIKIKECLVMQQREREEWALADTIIVPSQFVYDELVKEGADQEKLKLVPYGFDNRLNEKDILENTYQKSLATSKKVRILFCGNAGYRKGLHDFLKIAHELSSENVEFRIAGEIEKRFLSAMGKYKTNNVRFLGKMPFSQIQEEYRAANIFFLPSYIEGSAMVNYEAMSWALPVVTTRQSGSVLQNGINGFVSEAGDTETMKQNLLKLIHDSSLRLAIGEKGLIKLRNYSLQHYEQNLLSALKNDSVAFNKTTIQ